MVHGFNKVSGEPGPKAYFEASVSVRCQPIEGCQYREVAQGVSGRTSSRTFTPASTLIHVPGDTTSVRVAVRQCLDIKLMLGNDVCTDWSLVGPIDVPSRTRQVPTRRHPVGSEQRRPTPTNLSSSAKPSPPRPDHPRHTAASWACPWEDSVRRHLPQRVQPSRSFSLSGSSEP